MSDAAKPINTGAREWDAETYDAVSDPQFSWGMEVLGRLELRGDEDGARRRLRLGPGQRASCSSGCREGSLLAVDGSEAMVAKARERLGDRARYLVADLSELEIEEPVDLVFSTATFHWIPDHDRLFASIRAALQARRAARRPVRGRGQRRRRTRPRSPAVAGPARFAPHFSEMTALWNFAGAEETERAPADGRLRGRPLLAGAEAGAARATRSPSSRPSPSGPAPRPAAGGAATPLRRSRPRASRPSR